MPIVLGQVGTKYWDAAGLSTRLLWFIETYETGEGDSASYTDLMMSSCEDLLALIRSLPSKSVRAVLYLEVLLGSGDPNRDWGVRNVRRVWRAFDGRNAKDSRLIFEDERGELTDPVYARKPRSSDQLELLANLATAPRP